MARYALVIGIDTHQPPFQLLRKTAGDATAIADLLERHGNFLTVKRLIGTVTQTQLEGALQKLLSERASRGFREQQLETQQANLQAEWQTRNEKLAALRQDRIIETSTDRKFQLDKQIQAEEQEIELLNKKLSDIEEGLNRDVASSQQAERNDVVIYFTGYGFALVESFDEERVYLAPSDCAIDIQNERVVRQEKGVSLKGLNGLISKANLNSLVVLMECCYGEARLESRQIQEVMTAFTKTDHCLMATCRSLDMDNAFSEALLRSLQPEQNDRGEVTTGRVFDGIVSALQGTGQEPFVLGGGRSLTLVRYETAAPEQATIDETDPYQGLLAFTPATAKFFFGRDRVVQDLVGKLYQSNVVPLIGASGSGKSSVVRVGLVPWLEGLGWRVLQPMMPGTEPLETLRSFGASRSESRISSLYIGDVIAPADCYPRIPGHEPILLVIDQFEELFTLCRDRAEQSQFIDLLLNLPESGRMKAVITMRADFVEACLANEALTQVIQTNAVWLGAMAEADLEAAIVKPAAIQGMTLQDRLLMKILQDVEAEENGLPLLEFALQQVWDQRSGTELTLDVYQKLGGVTGALNAHAEEIYKQLAARKQEEWAKQVVLRLVRTGEGTKDTRQRQAKADLLAMGKDAGEKDAITAVFSTLVDGRLLVSDRINEQDVIDHLRLLLMEYFGARLAVAA
jgi:hypothetical protein